MMHHKDFMYGVPVCLSAVDWHTVGAVALIAQNGTVEVAVKGAFSVRWTLFCYSHPVHCLSKSLSACLFPCV